MTKQETRKAIVKKRMARQAPEWIDTIHDLDENLPSTIIEFIRTEEDMPRWHFAEPIIMEDPISAVRYAKYVLNERWLEAEDVITQDKKAWERYKRAFFTKRGNRKLKETWHLNVT